MDLSEECLVYLLTERAAVSGKSELVLRFRPLPVKQLMPKFVERAWEAGSSVALREFELELRRDRVVD